MEFGVLSIAKSSTVLRPIKGSYRH